MRSTEGFGPANVAVLRAKGSATAKKRQADGFKVMSVAEAAGGPTLMMMAAPDECRQTSTRITSPPKHP